MKARRAMDHASTLFSDRTARIDSWLDRLAALTGIPIPAHLNVKVLNDSVQGKASNQQDADIAVYIEPMNKAMFDRATELGQDWKDFKSGVSTHIRMLQIIERTQEFLIRRKSAAKHFTKEGNELRDLLRIRREEYAILVPKNTPQENQRRLQELLEMRAELLDPDNAVKYFKEGESGAYKDQLDYEGQTWADAEMYLGAMNPEYGRFYEQHYEKFAAIREELNRRRSQSGANGPIKDFVRGYMGWQHYMPFKSPQVEDLESFFDDFDVWESTGYLNDNTDQELKGKTKLSNDMIEQLQFDLLRSGKKLYEAEVAHAIKGVIDMYGPTLANAKVIDTYNTTTIKHDSLGKRPPGGRIARKPNTIVVQEGDVSHVIEIKDPDLFVGLKNQWLHTSDIANSIYKYTIRPIGNLKTKYNAPWVFYTNFIREFRNQLIYGTLDLGYKDGKYDFGISKKYLQNVLAFGGFKDALGYHTRDYLGKQQLEMQGSVYAKWANKLSALGGESTFLQSLDIQSIREKMDEMYLAAIGQTGVKGKLSKANEYYEGLINGVDLSTRVALFKAIVESGRMDEQTAAIYVKNLMNFNYRGKYGEWLRTAYIFYGPAAAGVFRMFQTFLRAENPAMMGALAAMYAGSTAMAYMLANMVLGEGDDGEDELKKVDDYTLIRNSVIPILGDNGALYVLPRALGMETVLAMPGILTARLLLGHTTETKAFIAAVKTALDNTTFVAPADPGDSINAESVMTAFGMTLVPSLARPIWESRVNTTAQGLQIWNPYIDKDTPKYMQGRDNTDQMYKSLSKLLYDSFGEFGDFTPESLKHNLTQYTGVLGTTAHRMATWNDKVLRGDPLTAVDIPLMPTLQTKDAIYYPQRVFSEARREWSLGKKRYKVITDEGLPMEQGPRLSVGLDKQVRSYDRKINKAIDAVRASNIPEQEKADRIRVLMETRQLMRAQTLAQWNAFKDQQ
jgi:hypothetical protein